VHAKYVLPDLCDEFASCIRVCDPLFRRFGGRSSYGGEIVTVKCHNDNSLVAQQLQGPGSGKVLVVDGGGSLRCGLLGDNLALRGAEQGWEGVIIYGCVRDVDIIATIDIGIQALGANPMKSVKRASGALNEMVTFASVSFAPVSNRALPGC
jgi:regulator of ribonuclease activity A